MGTVDRSSPDTRVPAGAAGAASPSMRVRVRALLPALRRTVPGGRVAIVRLHGPIGGPARTTELVELLRHLRESRRVPACVVDVDSPGGSATGSDGLFVAFERLAARKPLVAVIRGTGASGAYLAAMAAHRIIASPNAVVGSIGVISVAPRLPDLLERVGVQMSVRKAGRLKDMGAPWRTDTEEELAKEQELVDAIYDAFVGRVARARNMDLDRVRELATGEVWLGSRALELGLVDEIGDLERGVELAAELAGVPPRSATVRLRRPMLSRLTERFAARAATTIIDELESRLWDRYRT